MTDTDQLRQEALRLSTEAQSQRLKPEEVWDARLRADLYLCTAEVCERLERLVWVLEGEPDGRFSSQAREDGSGEHEQAEAESSGGE